jgi:hypothetical protein
MPTGCLGSLNENAFHVGKLPSFFRDCLFSTASLASQEIVSDAPRSLWCASPLCLRCGDASANVGALSRIGDRRRR